MYIYTCFLKSAVQKIYFKRFIPEIIMAFANISFYKATLFIYVTRTEIFHKGDRKRKKQKQKKQTN